MKNNPITFIRKCIRFITYDIWHMTADNISGTMRFLVSTLKAFVLSIRFFHDDRMLERASALTYYTLLSIVPGFALLLAIAKGFNMQHMVENWISNAETGHNETFGYIIDFGNQYLEYSSSSLVTGLGIVFLVWIIYRLLGNIEAVFNQIWEVKKGRSTIRKITDYLCIIIILPILVLIVSGLQVFSKTEIEGGNFDPSVSSGYSFLFDWVPYILIIIVFTAMYITMPNTKVRFVNALIAGSVAGAGFILFQNLYLSGQIWVSNYNAIYGSFAALPLLLLWIQMSWSICLYGAELSFAVQNMHNYEFETDTKNISRHYYDFLCCIVASLVYSQFPDRQFTTGDICKLLKLPSKLTSKIINHLCDLNVIYEAKKNDDRTETFWIPAKPVDKYSVASLLADIDNSGVCDFVYDYPATFARQWQTINQMQYARQKVGEQTLLREFQIDLTTLQISKNDESSTYSASKNRQS